MEKVNLDVFDLQKVIDLLKEGKCVIGTYSGLSTNYSIDFKVWLFRKGTTDHGSFSSEAAGSYSTFWLQDLHRHLERALQTVILNNWRKNHSYRRNMRERMMYKAVAKYYDCGILRVK